MERFYKRHVPRLIDFALEYGRIFMEVFLHMEIIFTVIIIMIIAKLVDKIYKSINLDHYSPIWEYFAKALLYGMITVFTMFYGKDSLNDVTPLEWAIISVSAIEGISNYINYVKETKARRDS